MKTHFVIKICVWVFFILIYFIAPIDLLDTKYYKDSRIVEKETKKNSHFFIDYDGFLVFHRHSYYIMRQITKSKYFKNTNY